MYLVHNLKNVSLHSQWFDVVMFFSYQLNPPQNRENSGFFRGKPTFRAVSWQITRAFHVISKG